MPSKTRRHTDFVQPLEGRRLMSFTPVGREAVLAGSASFDVAVAGDGSYYVATVNSVRSPSLGRNVNVLSVQWFDTLGRAGLPFVVSRYIAPNGDIEIDANAAGDVAIAYVERRGSAETLQFNLLSTRGAAEGVRLFTLPSKPASQFSVFGSISLSMTDAGGSFVAHRALDTRDVQIDYLEPGIDVVPDTILALDNATASYNGLYTLDVAARPDGSGAVFAAGVDDDGAGQIIYGSVSTTAKIGVDRRINSTAGDPASPALAVTAGNGFVMTYNDGTRRDSFGAMFGAAQRFDSAGVPVGTAAVFDDGLGGIGDPIVPIYHDVVALPEGGFAVAFVATDQDSHYSAYARRYAADGTADESGPVRLGVSDPRPNTIDADSYGNAVIAYAPVNAATRQLPGTAIHVRRVTSGIIAHRQEIYAIGTGGDDVIRIDPPSGVDSRVRVTVNGQTRRFPRGYVMALSASGLGGNDRIDHFGPVPTTLSGGDGDDTIIGGALADAISGGPGDDRLYGEGGNDNLVGGGGRDQLVGGDGDDQLNGGPGADRLYGNAGNDSLNGGSIGRDYLFGGDDTDTAVRDANDLLDSIER